MKEKLLLTTNSKIYVRVALPTPIRKVFDYLPQDDKSSHLLQQGARVKVPFGSRKLIGIIIDIVNKTNVSSKQLKKIIEIIDLKPLLPQVIQELLYWASTYYQYPLGLVLESALTSSLRKGKHFLDDSPIYWRLTELNNNNITLPTNASKQKQLIQLLAKYKDGIAENILNQQGFTKYIREKLQAKALIESYIKDDINELNKSLDVPNNIIKEQSLELNSAQQIAFDNIIQHLDTFKTFLLDGVTGSGKTEIYLQIIETVLQQNKQVLLLVPEISLTPQMVQRFKNRFSVPIEVFHSQLSDQQRTKFWWKAKFGQVSIIIGTRSAAFIPLKKAGLFLVDEEHDQSFKQQDRFCYSARDLLIKRAQLESCPIILGSATPSLESLYNSLQKRYVRLQLPERAGIAVCPKIEVLDIRHKKLKQGLSLQLLEQVTTHLNKGGQVLLFLNRRGYAPVLMCNACGWVQNCNHCDARMILHFYPKPKLICHHCQTTFVLPTACPNCKKNDLQSIGFGTEKLEHILRSCFPNKNIARVDKDIINKKNAMQNLLEKINSKEIDILIGTQMLAKGHHFPNLSLVAIIDIDAALFSTDFRTIEKMGQLITQVAGRAGREKLSGNVILQTQYPEHPLLRKLLVEGYHALCSELLKERQANMLPPFSYQILFKAASKNRSIALDFLLWLKNYARNDGQEIQVLGPVSAPIEKKAGYFRMQLLIQSNKRYIIHNACEKLIAKIDKYPKLSKIPWSIDVDPLDFY